MAIAMGSPAVNAGSSDGASATDQRGYPRSGPVDIGAYELQPDLIFVDGFEAH
ncbi:MAG: choice-of-anchor Q domain-containing protein [Dokdonella sp.]